MIRRGGRRVDEGRGRLRRPRPGPVAEMPRSSQGDASVPSTPLPTPPPCIIREKIRYTRSERDAETSKDESVPAPKPRACDVDEITCSLALRADRTVSEVFHCLQYAWNELGWTRPINM